MSGLLADAVSEALPFLRAEAEALMVDEFEMRDYGDGWAYNPTSGDDERVFAILYVTPGRVLTNTAASDVEVGGRTSSHIAQTLHVPTSTEAVPVGTVAHRVSDGAEFTVIADVTHPQPKSRRLHVERVLS